MDIYTWLVSATKRLKDIGIASARLDAELILANTLRQPRTYLHAHFDEAIDLRRVDIAEARLELRLDRVPLAYILGYKEFFGYNFTVSPKVLVPRPESEEMISLFLELTANEITPETLIDVGTGSGCLGISAALARPNLRVILSDISKKALQIAKKNAGLLGARVTLQHQSLLRDQIEPVDYIFANLPYVDRSWDVSPELRHEPEEALYADENGLKLIFQLLPQAARRLTQNGLLLLEADPCQHQQIITAARDHGFVKHAAQGYCIVLRLVAAKS